MDEARLRAWKALDLGPLWVSRRGTGAAQGEDVAAQGEAAAEHVVHALALEPGAGAIPTEESPTSAAAPPPVAARRAAPDARGQAGAARSPSAGASGNAGASGTAGALKDAGASGAAGLDWTGLQAAVEECRACALCETRTRTVFGAGPRDARWLVVGEAPGAEEDASGEPFVGQAGRLLDAMLASVGLDRGRNVFIANVVKCRPPGNRKPSPEEAASCLPFLRRQIELLAPDLVLLLGRVASNALLETDAAVGSLRGRVHPLRVGAREIPAVVTWHPSYLLRKPEDKALAWADLCLARASFTAAG